MHITAGIYSWDCFRVCSEMQTWAAAATEAVAARAESAVEGAVVGQRTDRTCTSHIVRLYSLGDNHPVVVSELNSRQTNRTVYLL